MLRELVWVHVLSGLILLICTTSGEGSMAGRCKSDTNCTKPLTCHSFFKVCVKQKSQMSVQKTRKRSPCNCRANEYCHSIFNTCLPYLTPPVVRNKLKTSGQGCKTDNDCQTGQYCHVQFKKCLDFLVIPTAPTTKSSIVPCKNDSHCTKKQYCHNFFKMCLVRPTAAFNTTRTKSTLACSNNSDCQPFDYCHNLTKTCLPMHSVPQSSMPSPPKKHGSCKNDSDCKTTEFCYNIFDDTSQMIARHRRKTPRPIAACVPKMVLFHSPLNCTSDMDCGNGRCCLKKLGICSNTLKMGQPCVTKNVDFTCACSAKMYCKPNKRGKKLKGRRLERKLKIPKYIRQLLVRKGLLYHTKYTYGRCQHVAY